MSVVAASRTLHRGAAGRDRAPLGRAAARRRAPGSGKTSVLVERFVRAVLEDGVDVSAILTITFTEKAAAELRDRIRDPPARARCRRGRARDRGRVHLDDPRLLRAGAARPRARGRDRPAVRRARPDRGGAARRRGVRRRARGARAERRRAAIDLIAAYGAGTAARRDPRRVRRAALARAARCRGCRRLPAAPARRRRATRCCDGGRALSRQSSARLRSPTVRVAQALARVPRVLASWSAGRSCGPASSTRSRCPAATARHCRRRRARRTPRRSRGCARACEHRRAAACARPARSAAARVRRAVRRAQARGPRGSTSRISSCCAATCCARQRAARALPPALRTRDGRRAPGHQRRAARADRGALAAATCSRSATRSSRSTASGTPTSSCSSGAASGSQAVGARRRCRRTSAPGRRSSRR